MGQADLKTRPARERKSRRARCTIYVRAAVSDRSAAARQRAECRRFVRARAAQGWTLVGEPYEDLGSSGMNLDRPGLSRLLRDAEAGCFDRGVVADVARLARDLRLLGEIAGRLGTSGVEVVVVGAEHADLGALLPRAGAGDGRLLPSARRALVGMR